MKKIKAFLVAFVILFAIALVPIQVSACTTFSSQCYFFIEEDLCKIYSCTYCGPSGICCHQQAGHCITDGGFGFFQYCDESCTPGNE